LTDGFKHRRGLLQDFVIPKPQHPKSLRIQESRPLRIIANLFGMLPAINLNNEAALMANKIHDVGTDRFLPLEFKSKKTMATQKVPKTLFGLSLLPAHNLGSFAQGSLSRPTATLSRLREREIHQISVFLPSPASGRGVGGEGLATLRHSA